MLFERLDTVLLRVSDVLASRAWYEEKLGLKSQYFDESEKLVVFDAGPGTSLTLWELKEGDQIAQSRTAAVFPIFSTLDAKEARERLKDRGVDVGEIIAGGDVTYFTFKDPDGNQLEACQVH
ncbi:MAG: VOC family protein [Acidobacteria bacterium]|nr:VOC family protein [Acidobacteriota bacterium]